MDVKSAALSDPLSYQAATEDCDMVMKGGITSGVVYPRAACRMATKFRFRRLGGSSAGAIAATVVAAAEAGRSSGGFVKLDRLPDELGNSLQSLFQPSPSTSQAFDCLTNWIDPTLSKGERIRRLLRLVAKRAPLWGLLTTLVTLLPLAAYVIGVGGAPRDRHGAWRFVVALLVASPVAIAAGAIVAIVSVAVSVYKTARGTMAAMAGNGFGLCDGHSKRDASSPLPLTDWMTEQLDLLAGIAPARDAPLTFGDLWGEPASAAYREAMGDAVSVGEARRLSLVDRRRLARLRKIDVVVMTTDLSHRRPYSFPFDAQTFLWCRQCWEKYFPDRVVTHLALHGPETAATNDQVESVTNAEGTSDVTIERVCPIHGSRLRFLPFVVDLPVVLAARFSLSFPGLISAVPMYAVDYATVPGKRRVKQVWFSDGGIASNFPMQFFDVAVPVRPTFGINLTPVHPDSAALVWRSTTAPNSGRLPRHREIASMVGFGQAIADTMQNWVDNMQITMRGFHDRIAEVRQRSDEGGMNLKMPADTITRLANRGSDAAALLLDFDLEAHVEQRFRIALAGTDEWLAALHDRFPQESSIREALPDVGTELVDEGIELWAMGGRWADAQHPAQTDAPRPQPQLRLTPRQ